MLTMVGMSVVSCPPPRADRVLIVSENCIPLACLLFAASRLDAWAIVVVNPRLHLIILVDSGDHLRSTHLRREGPDRCNPASGLHLAEPANCRPQRRCLPQASFRCRP